MQGIKRNLAKKISKLLEMFPVVVILGARQTGKTTLAQAVRPHWQYYDIENPNVTASLKDDPVFFFEQNPNALILDEVQTSPSIFNVLRGVIDQHRNQTGRFILTGSSSPVLLKNVTESLAGRAAIVQ